MVNLEKVCSMMSLVMRVMRRHSNAKEIGGVGRSWYITGFPHLLESHGLFLENSKSKL